MRHAVWIVAATGLGLLAGALCPMGTVRAQVLLYYSPADSILYMQAHIYDVGCQTVRFREGGARADSPAADAPGYVFATDGIAGHAYARNFNGDSVYRTTDAGESWSYSPIVPTIVGYGRGGMNPGESSITNAIEPPSVYVTSDAWQTYDSVHWNIDSQTYGGLSFQMGTLWGTTGVTTGPVYMSYDTGQTWTATGADRPISGTDFPAMGAPGELWGHHLNRVWVVRDSARTVEDSVYVLATRVDPYAWQPFMAVADHPGEVFMVQYVDDYWIPLTSMVWVFHIRNYGARVDSFYYVLTDLHPNVVPELRPATPLEFQITAFPNPFNSSVMLTWPYSPQRSTMVITDILGRRVWEWQGNTSRLLWDATGPSGYALPSGKYLVTVTAGFVNRHTVAVTLIR